MQWANQVDMQKFVVSAAPYGGPIGMWLEIYTSASL